MNVRSEKGDRKKSGSEMKVLVIIGAGASGMVAAIAARASSRSMQIDDDRFRIVLLERNPHPGAKIRISGGGKCNVTHEGSVDQLMERGFLRKEEQRFLRHSLYLFTNEALRELLERHGVATAPREDGKVFPVSGMAEDVLEAFERMLKESAIELLTGRRVSGVERNGEGFTVQTEAGPIEAASVIIATGGLSWSSLGTTGDGLAFASFLRHKVTPAVPALAPIYFTSPPANELAGVSLRSITLMAEAGNEKVERRGDLLFTHRGISGPASLSISRPAAELFRSQGAMEMFIDFFPEHSPEQLSKIFAKKASGNGRQMIRKFLQQCALAPPADDFEQKPFGTIPNVLVPLIMSKAGIDRDQQWSVMTKKQRPALVSVLKKFRIGSVRKIPLDQAEVSAGGVSLREVDSKSMESRLNRHLFFCGEVLDYAGEVGGFNLQAAFSTGWAAGSSAAASLLQ